MSEAVLKNVLARIERRLRLMRYLRGAVLVLCGVLFAGVLTRGLALAGKENPALWAIVVLVGILGLCLFAGLLLRDLVQGRDTLGRAAAVADQRANLKDEISSAYWFMGIIEPGPATSLSGWISHHVEKATRTAMKLDPAHVVPLSLPRSAWAAGGLAVLFAALSVAGPLAPAPWQSSVNPASSAADAEKAKAIRALLAKAGEGEAAQKLEQALAALERKNATEEEKRKALADAKEAVDKNNMEMSSMREGLMQLAERLRNTKEKSSTSWDNSERADRAKEMLDRMLGQRALQPHSGELDAESAAREKELEKLLDQASKATGTGEGQHFESAAPKTVVDRLEQIAKQLDAQSAGNEAIRQLTQMQQLQVAQTSIQSAGRYSSAQTQNPPTGTPSPDSGDTAMSGGIMFRTAAVAKGDKPSVTQEGSKSGAAAGESQAGPVIGNKETPLAVKLKKEGIRKEGEDGETGAEGWYYAESRAQASQVALQNVRANTRYTQSQAMDPEHISVKHRQVVKDYFLNLHANEAKPQ
ncbi:MAG: hypothetical protein EXR36_05385 [Betaproteobacteria bacterium]|nr:hypothetical protein [Betaproteobacteria bacterium]